MHHARRRVVGVGQAEVPALVRRDPVGVDGHRLRQQAGRLPHGYLPSARRRRDRPTGGREDVGDGPFEVREGGRDDRLRARTLRGHATQPPPHVLGQRVPAAQLAPAPEVHGVGDRAEHDVRRHGGHRHPVPHARLDEVVRHRAVRLLPGEQRGGARTAERGHEPLGPPGPVLGGPPHQPAEHHLVPPDETGGVLQVGHGHSADLPGQLGVLGPQQPQAEGLVLKKVFDVHGSGSSHLAFAR